MHKRRIFCDLSDGFLFMKVKNKMLKLNILDKRELKLELITKAAIRYGGIRSYDMLVINPEWDAAYTFFNARQAYAFVRYANEKKVCLVFGKSDIDSGIVFVKI